MRTVTIANCTVTLSITDNNEIADVSWKMNSPIPDEVAETQLYPLSTYLNNSDKYNWHDLRKNQGDLPEKDGLYIIAVENTEGIETGFGYFENMYGYSSNWSSRMPSFGKIIAWRYIEQFSEEI